MTTNMPKLKGEPPTRIGRHEHPPTAEHLAIVARLKSEPGSWFLVRTSPSPAAAQKFRRKIVNGGSPAFRGDMYEARTSGCEVYAKIVADG